MTLDKKSETEASIKVSMTAEVYRPAFRKKLKEESKKIEIRGFRDGSPGKLGMVKRRFGRKFLQEAVSTDAQKQVHQYLGENDIIVLGVVGPSKDNLEKIDWKEGDTFDLTFQIDMAAPFELVLDKQINVESPQVTDPSKSEVETHIENLRVAFGDWKSVKRIQLGDTVEGRIDYEKEKEKEKDKGELLSFVLTEAQLAKVDLTEKGIGDTVVLSPEFLKMANPLFLERLEEKTKTSTQEHSFTIQKIIRIIPAPLDQKFFDLILGPGVAQDLETFQEKIMERLLKQYQQQAEQVFQGNMRKALVQKAQIKLPSKYEAKAQQVAWDVIKRRIYKENKIEISPDELVTALSERHRYMLSNVPEDEREAMVKVRMQQDLKDPEKRSLDRIGRELIAIKLFEFIKEKITIVSRKVTVNTLQEQLRGTV